VKAANKRMAQKGLEGKLSPNAPPVEVTPAKKSADADGSTTPPGTEAVPVPKDPNLPEGAKPVAKVDEVTHSFGSVWIGPTLKHEFTLTNAGNAPLEITKVRPACGCTIAGTYPKTLAPGESGKFPFSMDSNKLRGKFEKSITISTNDPATPDLQLKLAGECQRYVDVTPQTASFSRITDQEVKEQKIAIVNNSETPLQLTVTPPPAGSKFTCELAEKTAGKNFELTIKANPPFEPGTLRDVVSLTTNVEAQKSIQIPINATIPQRIEVQPTEVTIGAVSAKAPAPTKRQLRLNNYGEKPVKILTATADDELLKVAVNEKTPGKEFTIDVEWPADYTVPDSGKNVTITTDDPSRNLITIPVRSTRMAKPDVVAQQTPAQALIGKPAPAFALKTTEGKDLSNATAKENVTVLTFFAPNCGFCKKMMPRVETIRPAYQEKGVRFVNVSETMKKEFSEEETKKILEDVKVTGELAIDKGNAVGPLFGANSYPTMVVLGKSGNVETVNVGNIPDLESRLSGQLDALLAGKPIPAELQAAAPAPKPKAAPVSEIVGKPAPAFTLKTLEGKAVANAELASAPATVLNFVAPNCGYCKKQLPRIETLKADYTAKGVRFVNVSETMGTKTFTPEEVVNVIKGAGSTNELAIDEGNTVGKMFQANGYPTMVIVGKDGKVAAVNSGNLADLETRMKGQLDAVIAGKPVPTFDAPPPAVADPTKPAQQPQRPAMELQGKPAPKFSINTLQGKPVSDGEFAKHPATILNFVAPNCGFCKKQMPIVETLRKEYEAKGVRFVNMSQTMRKEYTAEEALDVFKGAGWGGEMATDAGNAVGQQFKAMSYPTMVVVGKDGTVAQVNIGASPDLETKLKGALDAMIAGKPIPTPAAPAAAPNAVPVPIPAPTPTPAPAPVKPAGQP